jgi:hypothetical protein
LAAPTPWAIHSAPAAQRTSPAISRIHMVSEPFRTRYRCVESSTPDNSPRAGSGGLGAVGPGAPLRDPLHPLAAQRRRVIRRKPILRVRRTAGNKRPVSAGAWGRRRRSGSRGWRRANAWRGVSLAGSEESISGTASDRLPDTIAGTGVRLMRTTSAPAVTRLGRIPPRSRSWSDPDPGPRR